MAAPILNLDSLVDRPTVVIGGKEYWLLTIDVLPPLDAHHLQFMSRRVGELMSRGDDLTAEEKAQLQALPDRMCRLVLVAPDDVHTSRTDPERMLIAETALTTFRSGLRMFPPIAAPEMAESPSTGASLSLDSPASTAALQ